MSPQDTDPLHAALTDRLASLVADQAAPPVWYEAWQLLGPDATEAQRLDVAKWFRKLPAMKRRVARVLATGETTQATAKRFSLTAGRVSQLRRELHESWNAMQGEPVAA